MCVPYKLKKLSMGWRGGDFIPLYATDPMLIIFPYNLKGHMISKGSAAQGGPRRGPRGGKKTHPPTSRPPLLSFFKSYYPFRSVKFPTTHVRNALTVFSCGLNFSSDLITHVRQIGIYNRLKEWVK